MRILKPSMIFHSETMTSDMQFAKERNKTELSFGMQIRTANGFIGMARLTLELMLQLVRNDPVGKMFMQGTLPTHSAHLCLHLIEQLIGENSQDISSCTDISWRPGRILADIVGLLIILARDPAYVQVWPVGFLIILARDPAYVQVWPVGFLIILARDPAYVQVWPVGFLIILARDPAYVQVWPLGFPIILARDPAYVQVWPLGFPIILARDPAYVQVWPVGFWP
jgi:hypothetical protein